jgi:hypothetical protein
MNDNIQEIIDLMERDDSVTAPEDSIKWAKSLFRTKAFEPKVSAIRRLVAALQMDIDPGSVVFGERSAGSAVDRQLFYTADEIGIQIHVSKVKKSHTLRGQLMTDNLIGSTVTAQFGESIARTEIDSEGGFIFASVPSGELSISIASEDLKITIPFIEV